MTDIEKRITDNPVRLVDLREALKAAAAANTASTPNSLGRTDAGVGAVLVYVPDKKQQRALSDG